MRHYSKWFVMLLVAFMFLAVTGCADDPPEDVDVEVAQEIVVGTILEIPSLDPFLEASATRTERSVLMYEGLTWVNYDNIVEPVLAEDWDISEDGTVYTFYLRQDVYFHNGEKMTAEDVQYSYSLFLDPDFPSGGSGDFTPVDEIRVIDEYKVEFILKHPYATLLAAVGGRYGGVVPKGTYDDGGDLRTEALGTGPYKLVNWTPDSSMVLERFDQYWNDEIAHLDKITIQIIPSEDSLIAGLRSGEIDFSIFTDPRSYFLVEGMEGLIVEQNEKYFWNNLEFANDTPPTDDVRVRQAIALAIDKEEILASAIDGVGTVIGAMPSAFGDWVVPREQLPHQKRDLEAAKALLEAAGYGDGMVLPLRIIAGIPWYRAAAEVIASNLAEVGIDVEIETVELGVWIEDWVAPQTPTTLNSWGGFMDPDVLYYRHFRSRPEGADFRRWKNEEADRLLDAGRASTAYEERLEIYAEFQQLMATDLPGIPLFSPNDVNVWQDNIAGYIHHPSGWWYGLVYVKVQ